MIGNISPTGYGWAMAAAETLIGLYFCGGPVGLASAGAALAVRTARKLGGEFFGRQNGWKAA